MSDPVGQLRSLEAKHEFFVGIDSDGCAFDSMEIKHKECFIPNTINSWELQAVARFAREAAEFVNLYSRWRGMNRFPALVMVLDLLADRPEAVERGYKPPEIGSLRAWIEAETRLGNPALEVKVAETSDPVLTRTLEWSKAVNATIGRIVRGVPPLPFVTKCLDKLQDAADMMVVSATPIEALRREWDENDIARYVRMICGQEQGTKKEHLKYGAVGKYDPSRILMIGDVPGDLKSAQANNVLFYPIRPGNEEASWQRLYDEAADKFLAGEYAGDYQVALIDEFMQSLPSKPPWK